MGVADLVPGIILFIVFAITGCFLLSATPHHAETLPFQTRLFLTAFVIRFAASLALYVFGLVNTLKDEDAAGWMVGAAYQQQWEQAGRSPLDAPSLFLESYAEYHKGYYYLLGVFFLITGAPGRLAAAALNCFVGALTIVFTYRMARSLFSEQVAQRAGWLACFFPSLIIWSAQTLKEPVVIFLETLALYGCVRLNRFGFTPRYILLVGMAAVLLLPFRFYAAYLVLGTVCVSLLVPRVGSGQARLPSLLGVGVVIVLFVAFSGVAVQQEARLERYDLKYIQSFRAFAAKDQGSGVQVEADLESPSGMGLALLVGGLHLLLAPFPWQWVGGSLRMLLVVPEVLLWWWLLFYGVVPGLRHALRNRLFDVLPLLIFILGMGLFYSLIFGNVGLVYRQHAPASPLAADLRGRWDRVAADSAGPAPGRRTGDRPSSQGCSRPCRHHRHSRALPGDVRGPAHRAHDGDESVYHFVTQVFKPYTLCCLGLALTLIWLWRRCRELKFSTGRLLLLTGPAVLLLLLSVPALAHPLLGTLEWQYPPQDKRPQDADAIVVLDAGIRFPNSVRKEAEPDFDSMRRCIHAAKLYHQGKPCPVVVTGGYRDPAGSGQTAAGVLADFLVQLGVKRSDLILEEKSLSTYENAVGCRDILEERGIHKIVLVTDATHLCRAVRCFRRQGIDVSPSGCWYQAAEFPWKVTAFLPSPGGASAFQAVFHEWAGLAWYWMHGRI